MWAVAVPKSVRGLLSTAFALTLGITLTPGSHSVRADLARGGGWHDDRRRRVRYQQFQRNGFYLES